jgi:hypothetical protein
MQQQSADVMSLDKRRWRLYFGINNRISSSTPAPRLGMVAQTAKGYTCAIPFLGIRWQQKPFDSHFFA